MIEVSEYFRAVETADKVRDEKTTADVVTYITKTTADSVRDETKADLRAQLLEATVAHAVVLWANKDPGLVCLGSFGEGPLISTEYKAGRFIQRTTNAGEPAYKLVFTEREIVPAQVWLNLNELPEISLICAAAAAETAAAKYK